MSGLRGVRLNKFWGNHLQILHGMSVLEQEAHMYGWKFKGQLFLIKYFYATGSNILVLNERIFLAKYCSCWLINNSGCVLWPTRLCALVSQNAERLTGMLAKPDIGCLSLVDLLCGPGTKKEIGCQICVWLQAPLPDYHTLCRAASKKFSKY